MTRNTRVPAAPRRRVSPPAPSGATRFDVVGLGVNTHDHVCVLERPPRIDSKQRLQAYLELPGGQVPTALVALQRWGLRTAYVGPFGDDAGGRQQHAALAAEGVDLTGSHRRIGVASQTSVILIDEVSGERTVLWARPDALALRRDELDRTMLAAGRALLLDADDVEAAILAASWAKEAGRLVMLDVDAPGPRTEALLALSDVAIVSDQFVRRYTGRADLRAALRAMTACGPVLAAATLGCGGAVACIDRTVVDVPPFRVAAVDSTSAGDLFHAGCLYGLLQGWEPPRALRFASAAAALACAVLGGRASVPQLPAVLALLNA